MVVSGAYSALPPASSDVPSEPPSPTPSFVLLDLQGPSCCRASLTCSGSVVVCYVWVNRLAGRPDRRSYQLIDGEVRVEKIEQVRRFLYVDSLLARRPGWRASWYSPGGADLHQRLTPRPR